jgi:hypothetical protein
MGRKEREKKGEEGEKLKYVKKVKTFKAKASVRCHSTTTKARALITLEHGRLLVTTLIHRILSFPLSPLPFPSLLTPIIIHF